MGPDDPSSTSDGDFPSRRTRSEPEPFGKYFLIDRIAVGGMAEIFRARSYGHAGFEKDLVIKRILAHLTENDEFVQMFIEEAKLTVQLQHPNIVQVYDFGKILENYYLAMEGPYGRDLKTVMARVEEKQSQLPLRFAALLLHEMARGLFYAHNKRDEMGSRLEIVHRDVSPSNIHISWDGQVKLLDFGIAKASKSTFENTEQGVLKGKFEYMSPEQAQGKVVDHRSDIFSAGICMWEMVTGGRLFKSDTPLLTLSRIKAGEVPLVRQENPEVPRALADIIHRALAYGPEDRYQSAEEMRKDVEAYLKPSTTAEITAELADWVQELFMVDMEMERLRLEEARKSATVMANMEDTVELDLLWDDDEEMELEEDEEERDTIDDEETELVAEPAVVPIDTVPPKPKGKMGLWIGLFVLLVIIGGGVAAALILPGLLAPPVTVVPDPVAVLAVEISPPEASDAQVRLDGEPIWLPYDQLQPGAPHHLEVAKEGFATHEEDFQVAAGETRTIAVTLQPDTVEPVTEGEQSLTDTSDRGESATAEPPTQAPVEQAPAIVFRSTPSGASVSIGGRNVGRTAYRYEGGTAGENVVAEFSLDGYRDAAAGGVFPSSGSITVRATLDAIPVQQPPGFLTINATPWADVFVDGKAVGQTPIGSLEVEPGTHTVRLVCPPLEAEKTTTVTVGSGETKPVSVDLEE